MAAVEVVTNVLAFIALFTSFLVLLILNFRYKGPVSDCSKQRKCSPLGYACIWSSTYDGTQLEEFCAARAARQERVSLLCHLRLDSVSQ